MAQYRAIFKNANIAMVAAIAAAALASGQAQAATGQTFTNDTFKKDAAVEVTMDGTDTADDTKGQYKNFTISGSSGDAAFTNDQANVLTVTGGSGASGSVFKGKDANGTGTISLAKTSLVIAGTKDNSTDTVVSIGEGTSGAAVTLGSVTAEKGTLDVVKGSLTAGTLTLNNKALLKLTDGDVSADSITLESGSVVDITKGSLGKAGNTITVAAGAKIDTQATDNTNAKVLSNLDVSGTLNVDASKAIKIEGEANFLSGSTFVSKGVTVLAKGGSIDDKATLTVEAGSDIRIGDATLTLSSDNLKKLISGTKVQSMSDKKAVIALNDETSAEKALDLATTTIIGASDGVVSAKLVKQGTSGSLTVQGGYAKYAGENKIEGQEGVTLSFKGLTVGKDAAVSFNKGGISVSESLSIKDKKALTLDSGNALTLDGATGSVDAASVTIGSSAAAGTLNVKNGTWTLPDLTVTSGSATVEDQATLKVNGKLTATKAGQLLVKGGTVDVQGSGSSLVLASAEAKTVQLSAGGVLKIDPESHIIEARNQE